MNPDVKLAVLCDYALTSQDGKLSVLGIFSQMNMAQLPGITPPYFAVVVLSLDPGTYSVRFGVVDPVGQQVLTDETPEFDMEVETAGADTNLVIQFNNLPLSRPGIYQVQLFVDGRLTYSLPLNVQSAGGPELSLARPN
jgi:uncharacterized protein DUF6941